MNQKLAAVTRPLAVGALGLPRAWSLYFELQNILGPIVFDLATLVSWQLQWPRGAVCGKLVTNVAFYAKSAEFYRAEKLRYRRAEAATRHALPPSDVFEKRATH